MNLNNLYRTFRMAEGEGGGGAPAAPAPTPTTTPEPTPTPATPAVEPSNEPPKGAAPEDSLLTKSAPVPGEPPKEPRKAEAPVMPELSAYEGIKALRATPAKVGMKAP